MADGCSMRKARAERRREGRARVLRQDARFLDHGGQSIRVPRRRRRARRAERTASQSRRAIHSLSREPQPGTATRAGRAPLRDSHLPLVPAKAGTRFSTTDWIPSISAFTRVHSAHLKGVYARLHGLWTGVTPLTTRYARE